MRSVSLPVSLAEAWGHLPNLKKKTRNEWSSSCPVCGGTDRFVMREEDLSSRGWCRQCGHFAFAKNAAGKKIDPETAARMEREAEERRAFNEARKQERLATLQESKDYLTWHENLPPYAVEAWNSEGIPPSALSIFKLGWNPERPYTDPSDGLVKFTPALTIPYLSPAGSLTTIQFKLMNVSFRDRYRFFSGIDTSLFYCPRDGGSKTLVVEGAKKAMVSYLFVGAKYNIVALPSKNPGDKILSELRELDDELFILLDPDAHADNANNPRGETSAQ